MGAILEVKLQPISGVNFRLSGYLDTFQLLGILNSGNERGAKSLESELNPISEGQVK